jgi:hypothetical protein
VRVEQEKKNERKKKKGERKREKCTKKKKSESKRALEKSIMTFYSLPTKMLSSGSCKLQPFFFA